MNNLKDIKYVIRTPKGELVGKTMKEAEILAKIYIEDHGFEGVTIEKIYVYDIEGLIPKSFISPKTISDKPEIRHMSKEELSNIDLYKLSNDSPDNRVKYTDEPMLDLMYRK